MMRPRDRDRDRDGSAITGITRRRILCLGVVDQRSRSPGAIAAGRDAELNRMDRRAGHPVQPVPVMIVTPGTTLSLNPDQTHVGEGKVVRQLVLKCRDEGAERGSPSRLRASTRLMSTSECSPSAASAKIPVIAASCMNQRSDPSRCVWSRFQVDDRVRREAHDPERRQHPRVG